MLRACYSESMCMQLDNVKNVWLALCLCVKSCIAAVQMDLTARLLCVSEAKGIK